MQMLTYMHTYSPEIDKITTSASLSIGISLTTGKIAPNNSNINFPNSAD